MHASPLIPHVPLIVPGLQLPRLYTFRRCPYAMRARMALLQAGQAFEAVEVSLRDKPASLLALSPKATVPVLQLPDGRVIEESWDIMRWALAAPDAQGWWARAQSPANLELLHRTTATSSITWTAGMRCCGRWRHGCTARPAWAAPRHAPPTWQ
jgi:glutathione S-transferase